MVMEYISGTDLETILDNEKKLSIPASLRYFKQILSALDFAHKLKVIHRDIRPSNILIDEKNNIKITEKGGKAVGLMQVRAEDEVVMITNSGKLIRTLAGNISLHGRNTQGVRLMDVEGEAKIVSIGRVAEREQVANFQIMNDKDNLGRLK